MRVNVSMRVKVSWKQIRIYIAAQICSPQNVPLNSLSLDPPALYLNSPNVPTERSAAVDNATPGSFGPFEPNFDPCWSKCHPRWGVSSTKNVNCYFLPSLMMMCSGGSVEASSNASGSWTGYNTDVCMRPDCGTTTGNVLKPKYILIKMTKCCDATVASQMKRTYIPQQWNVATQHISKFRFISTNITWKELIISSCGYVTGFLMISIRVILFISRYS